MDQLLLQQVAKKFIGLGCSSGVVSCQILLERCKLPVSKEKNDYKAIEKWENIVRGNASKYKHKWPISMKRCSISLVTTKV